MKDWNRTVRLDDADVVVQRTYGGEENKNSPYKVEIIVNVDGALNKVIRGYPTDEKQLNAYKSITDEEIQGIFENVMMFH